MKASYIYIGLVVVLLLVAVTSLEFVRSAYEVVSLRLVPSAERAVTYGQRHFSSGEPEAYNIRLAEYFLWQAESMDEAHPHVYHEIARIEFLKGQLNSALIFIDRQIQQHGDQLPNAYYIRGLIEGYRGEYDRAAEDYERYLMYDPNNWAARTDLAWVLLKAGRYAEAAQVTDLALELFPGNPWLLNTNAIAYFELGEYQRALTSVRGAFAAVEDVTEEEWLTAYPGNDPKIAHIGLATFRQAIADNMHRIEETVLSGAVQ